MNFVHKVSPFTGITGITSQIGDNLFASLQQCRLFKAGKFGNVRFVIMAAVLAVAGKRVLLIDDDMSKRHINHFFGLESVLDYRS